jgi:hypothetical protein
MEDDHPRRQRERQREEEKKERAETKLFRQP